MDLFSFLLAFVPATLGLVVSVIHACIKFREAKKDDVWETVTRLLCSTGTDPINAVDDFVEIYNALKLYKDGGCKAANSVELKRTLEDFRNIDGGL